VLSAKSQERRAKSESEAKRSKATQSGDLLPEIAAPSKWRYICRLESHRGNAAIEDRNLCPPGAYDALGLVFALFASILSGRRTGCTDLADATDEDFIARAGFWGTGFAACAIAAFGAVHGSNQSGVTSCCAYAGTINTVKIRPDSIVIRADIPRTLQLPEFFTDHLRYECVCSIHSAFQQQREGILQPLTKRVHGDSVN
jgi:hypothetical protein